MENKYSFWVQYSIEDECYLAFVYELPGLTAHGDTPDEALREVQVALSILIDLKNEGKIEDIIPESEPMAGWDSRPFFLKEKWNSSKTIKKPKTAMVSGHLDLTQAEFDRHYLESLYEAVINGHKIIVGDANGADRLAVQYLKLAARYWFDWDKLTVYHMLELPRTTDCRQATLKVPLVGGFKSDEERDAAMTAASDYDIAWVRPGREKSGTARNIARRKSK